MANIHTFGLQECLSWHTLLHKLIEVQPKTETLERTKIYIKLTNSEIDMKSRYFKAIVLS
jgi:hypothetical protein